MGRSDSFWLTLTNIMMGVALLVCVLIAVLGTLSQTLSNAKKRRSYRAELNHDMQEMFPVGLPPLAVTRTPRPKSTHGLIGVVRGVCRRWLPASGRKRQAGPPGRG